MQRKKVLETQPHRHVILLNEKSTNQSFWKKNMHSFHCIKRNPGYWVILSRYLRNTHLFFSRLTT